MNRRIQLLLIICLAISGNNIFAQSGKEKVKPEKFFALSPSLNYINLNNPCHTIVRYSGLGYSINLGLKIENPKKQEGVYLHYLKGGLTSENELNTTNVFQVELGYFLKKRIFKLSETTNWYLGGDISTFLICGIGEGKNGILERALYELVNLIPHINVHNKKEDSLL